MQAIVPTINPGDTGASAANLVEAVLLLIERAIIASPDAVGPLASVLIAKVRRELTRTNYGPVTRGLVILFQIQQGLGERLGGTIDEATASVINRFLRDLGVLDVPPPRNEREISGVVVMEHGAPAVNLPLRLFRRGFADAAQRLGEARTGVDGAYAIGYPRAERETGLEIRAVAADGSEVPLTRALFDLDASARIDLVAPSKLQPPQPEFARLRADLGGLVGEVGTLARAKEGRDRQDLSLLNRATGWDARLLALASKAAALSADGLGLAPEAAYALLRTGLPSDMQQLARVGPEVIGEALKKAVDAGIVAMTEGEIATARKKFTSFARKTRLAQAAPGSRSTYGDLLKASGLSDAAQKTFASVYTAHSGSAAELWDSAKRAGLADAEVKKLQQQGKLAFLTLNNHAVTERLRTLGIEDPVTLVDRDFHRPETWDAELRRLAGNDAAALDALVPPAYVGANAADRLGLYTVDLARKVRIAFPTRVAAHIVEQDAADAFKLGEARAPTAQLLKNLAGAGFRLGTHSIRKFVGENPGVRSAVAQPEAALRGVSTLQRVYQIAPSDDAMATLISLGLTSAFDVVALSEEVFVQRHAKRFRTRDEARLVHRKSRQVSAVTYNLFTIAKKLDGDTPLYGLSPAPAVKAEAKDNLIKQFPTLEALFGSMDFCECEHCRSILGPAAYLVDLLQFIDREPLEWASFLADWKLTHGGVDYGTKYQKPYDALIERRPDLPHIALTCENTNVAMPYIDIVNEILEYHVFHGALDEKAARDTGDATTPELIAEPQNIIGEAYDKVRDAKYPLSLPFDLWLETVRRFSDYFETPFASVLEAFRTDDELFAPAPALARSAIFFESLGLTPAELAIFTDPAPLSNWFELYGFTTAAKATTVAVDASTGQRIDLHSAKALSRRLDVTYLELTGILRTAFVNPKLEKLAVLDKLDVAPADIFAYKNSKAFHEANKDLIGADRAALSVADQARYDALTIDQWATLEEVAAFVQRLDALTSQHPASGIVFRDWLDDEIATGTFDEIVVLASPDAGCDMDETTIRHAGGAAADPMTFLKINLFARLWRKLGWSIEETDRALQTFIHQNTPFDSAHLSLSPLRTALIYCAHLKALDARLRAGRNSRLKLLALWSPIATTGKHSLYAQLFLTRGVLKSDPIFDDPLGRYLGAPQADLKDHMLALQGALGLTADDLRKAIEDSGQDPESVKLSIDSVSIAYRYGLFAKALGLSVSELIAVKQLTGLDPFKPVSPDPPATLADDVLFSQTLAFVDVVQWIRDLGLKISDLQYLLRHRFDPAAAPGPDPAAAVALVRTLSIELRAIQAEHALPANPGDLTDDMLRQKLGLVFPSDVVDRFLAMLNNSIETSVTRAGVAPADRLVAERFAGEASIAGMSFNPARQEQELIFRGILSDAQKSDLKSRLPTPVPPDAFAVSPLLASLLDAVQAEQSAFFVKHLQKQASTLQPASGFLDPADFDLLFAPPPAGLTEAQSQIRVSARRARLATAFLPFLQQRLARRRILDALSAEFGADPALVELLLSNAGIIGDPEPPTAAFAATVARGASATFHASADGTGPALADLVLADVDCGLKDATGAPVAPAGTQSATFAGYLEVPAAGAYRFFVAMGRQNAEAELRFDHLAGPLLNGKAATDGDEISQFLELRAGILYRFELDAGNLGGGGAHLLVQGESLPKDRVRQLALYPDATIARATRALTLVRKVLLIVQSLGLTGRELYYLTTNAAAFDDLHLGALPVDSESQSLAQAQALFKGFARVAAYARLKRDLAGGTDMLISVFEAPGLDAACSIIASLTRRDAAIVKATAETLWAAPALTTERPIARLWDALRIVERFGVQVASIAGWTAIVDSATTPDRRLAIARGVKEAIKSRFGPEAWRRAAQSIFDPLRQRQRDALVAYSVWKNGFERPGQLYEYFLIDPGMEPVVQTSRIRLAIGSVQLFIQRCLLNLEKKVPPGALNARHWEWTARYRVWEANRKIFLYPENWLEPEFRTDKTHLFAELEGTLLQGDVSNDLVEDALLTYLQNLDELARLDLVAMHLEDGADPARRRLHLFGRTHGSPHKYFYRRQQRGIWTPWEPVAPKIDGDHLAPAIWRDRLYLFWVTFEFRPEQPGPMEINPNGPFTVPALMNEVILTLHWSACLDGEWTAPEASDPLTVTTTFMISSSPDPEAALQNARTFTAPIHVAPGFDPKSARIHVSKEPYENGEERGIFVHVGGLIAAAFYMAGRNSTPVLRPYSKAPPNPYSASTADATRFTSAGALKVTYKERITTEAGKPAVEASVTRDILRQGRSFSILPCDNHLYLGAPDPASIDADNPAAVTAAMASGVSEMASLIKPFVYQDDVSTFYVQPEAEERTLERWEEWVTPVEPSEPEWRLPNWWKDLVVVASQPKKGFPIGPDDFIPQAGAIYGLAQRPTSDWLTNPSTGLLFDGEIVGVRGRADSALSPRIAGGATPAVTLRPERAGAAANIIGGGGLNSQMLNNLTGRAR